MPGGAQPFFRLGLQYARDLNMERTWGWIKAAFRCRGSFRAGALLHPDPLLHDPIFSARAQPSTKNRELDLLFQEGMAAGFDQAIASVGRHASQGPKRLKITTNRKLNAL